MRKRLHSFVDAFPYIVQLYWWFPPQRDPASINKDILFARQELVPVQKVLEYWSLVLEMYLNVLEFCLDKTLLTLSLASYHIHRSYH